MAPMEAAVLKEQEWLIHKTAIAIGAVIGAFRALTKENRMRFTGLCCFGFYLAFGFGSSIDVR